MLEVRREVHHRHRPLAELAFHAVRGADRRREGGIHGRRGMAAGGASRASCATGPSAAGAADRGGDANMPRRQGEVTLAAVAQFAPLSEHWGTLPRTTERC